MSSSPFIRWPSERLDAFISAALAEGRAMIEPTDSTHQISSSLRHAIYRRLQKQQIGNITVMLQGTVVVLLRNDPPELKQIEQAGE